MKKFAGLAVLLFLAAFIVLPASSTVNYNVSKPILAEGSPLPWPVPKPPSSGVLTAEGSPLPWPVPKPPTSTVLTAEGSPLPWPVPKPLNSTILTAEGSPLPWPVPKPPLSQSVA